MPLTNPYQVTETDKDLLKIAEQQGFNFQELKKLNPNITSISPGQFINTPPKLQYSVPAGPPTLSPGASAAVSGFTQPSGPYNISSGVNQYLSGANLPAGYPGPYHVPGSLAAPVRPADSQFNLVSSNGDRDIESQNDMIRVFQLKTTMENATDPSQLPKVISNADAARMGYPPAQMIQAGYVMKNGNWINAKGTSGSVYGAGGVGFQSANNWQTNDALHLITFNKNAKNKHSKFETNLKWAKNAWKRKKRAAKGIGARTEPGAEIRADTPSTTLDLVLGS
jgi:hypothetical protein